MITEQIPKTEMLQELVNFNRVLLCYNGKIICVSFGV